MGQFSWICADTRRELIEQDIDTDALVPDTWTKKAYLLIPAEFGGGHYSVDGNYGGYGIFYDGKGKPHDAYEELAKWNGVEGKDSRESRNNAIDLYYKAADPSKSQYADYNHNVPATMKYPLKITEEPRPYEAAGCATDDPDQGWGQYRDDEDC